MNRATLIDIANNGDVDAVEKAINASIAKTLKRTIRMAKNSMEFKAAECLIKIQPKYGKVPTKGPDVTIDLKKFSSKLELTFDNKNTDFNSLVIGACSGIGKLTDQTTKGTKETYVFAFKPEDAKTMVTKLDKIAEVNCVRFNGAR